MIEQFWFWRASQGLPGPSIVWPFFGNVFEMVYDPFKFWDKQDKMGPLSWNSIFGTFMLFCQDTSHSIAVMKQASNNVFQVCLNLNGQRLLGDSNIAFLQGDVHKRLRGQLLHLFTKRALGKYISVQEACIRSSMKEWFEMSKSTGGVITMRDLVRDLNIYTSQSVFVGPYLTPETRKELCDDYMLMNEGLLCMPFSFPGSTLWRAIRARKRVTVLLGSFAAESKKRMRAARTDDSIQPECLLDFWMVGTNERLDEWEKKKAESDNPESIEKPLFSDDYDIGHTVLDFLFASQDASSASLTWVCHFLGKNPDMLKRVRDEQAAVRPNDENLDLENLAKMQYTRQFMKEVLRFRAPATLIPHVALTDVKLNNEVTIPKGTLVCPSLYSSSFQGFTDPYTFDPDRFSPERKEDVIYKKHFLVFGSGPHRCIGYEYAMFHLLAFTAIFAANCEFEHIVSPSTEEIVYGPTIYPGDGCVLKVAPRTYA